MSDIISSNFSQNGKQTFIIPLTYPDISDGVPDLERIGYGGDVWEIRADLLSDSAKPLGRSNLPRTEYVRDQVKILQGASSLPILFTIRTVSQGGKFPDDAADEALELMLEGVRLGCEYIDVEIEWPQGVIDALVASKGSSMLMASFHSWTGSIRWTSDELRDKYQVADKFGDIIKLSILSVDVYDCHELALFVRAHRHSSEKPLLAVGMGRDGQLSRVLSPISLVTHKLVPFPSAPGQLTLAQVHQAQHLIGQLPEKRHCLVGEEGGLVAMARGMHQAGLDELGLPHAVSATESETLRELSRDASFGGAAVFDAGEGSLGHLADVVTDAAARIGFVDTLKVTADKQGPRLVGDNFLWEAIRSLAHGFKRSDASSLVLVVDDDASAAAACFAAEQLQFKTAHYFGDDSQADKLKETFPQPKFARVNAADSAQPAGIILVRTAEGLNSEGVRGHLGQKPAGTIIDLTNILPVHNDLPAWTILTKRDVVKQVALLQFQAWTGRRAPECVMMENV